jgi:hypothetical protein
MRRDIDLIRKILIDLEQQGAYTSWMDVDIEEYSPEQMDYHLELMIEAGLIDVRASQGGFSRQLSLRLTWQGHEFLDLARDTARWEKVKASAGQAGGIPVELFRAALAEIAKGETDAHLSAAG